MHISINTCIYAYVGHWIESVQVYQMLFRIRLRWLKESVQWVWESRSFDLENSKSDEGTLTG